MSLLLKLHKQSRPQADFTYPWHEVVSLFLHQQEVSSSQIEVLKHSLLDLELSTPEECFFFFRHFLILALVCERGVSAVSLEPLFAHAEAHPYWRASTLSHLYLAVCKEVCGLTPSKVELPSMARFEGGERWTGIPTLKMQEGVEYATLLGLLGLLKRDEEMQKRALGHAQWIATLLDHRDFPFFSLWSEDHSCDLPAILSMNSLLFSLCDRMTKQPHWHLLSERQLSHFQEIYAQGGCELPLLPPLLLGLLEEADPGLSFCFDSSLQLPVQLMTKRFAKGSCACTLAGRNSGIGAFHKDRVKVVNFGPWASPLGECLGFGVKHVQSTEYAPSASSLRGWTRLQPTTENPDTWADIEVETREEALHLTFSPTPLTDAGVLSFAFLVHSEEAQIGNHRFFPATMCHYVGESASVSFFSGKEKIEIATAERRDVELIPLAGGKHFWGANFLLAFSITPSDPVLSCSIF